MVMLHALGAVGVTVGQVELPLGGPRQRRLLAVLLLHHDHVVSVDRIAEAVFAGAPTPGAATTLRSYVARLRRVLAAAGASATITTRPPGYQLLVSGDEFDVTVFEASVTGARTALEAGEPERALSLVREGLARWSGLPYAEFADEEWVYAEVQRLTELRLVAHELLVDAELALGHGDAVVPLLESLCAEHPLREGYRSQLMTAYYGSGRQADALAAFRDFRHELGEELGIDPSPALVELEHQILAQDPALLRVPRQRGATLRGYQLGERLGTGIDGTVQAARLPGVEQEFAVKKLRADIADDPRFVRSFDHAARRLASVRHPGVLPLHDYWREPGAAYVVTARMPGSTLRDRIRRRAVGLLDVRLLLERVGGGLTAAEEAGVRHGRICAENVLYDHEGNPLLGDFWLGQPDRVLAAETDRQAFLNLVRECLTAAPDAPAGAQALEVPSGDSETMGTLVHELSEVLAAGPAADLPRHANPYLGLRAFDEGDAALYFGREALVQELVDRLDGSGAEHRLVLLVGASGTGKSSVVRAGLLPRLRAGAVAGSQDWFVTAMLPGAAPFRGLAQGLWSIATRSGTRENGDGAGQVDRLSRDLAAGDEGLHRTLCRLLPSGGEVLVVLDQLEELFTLSPEGDRRAFLDALVHALTAPDSRLRVVATLRADFYDRPLGVQSLGRLVSATTVAIPAMLPAEIEAAIVEPARRAGRSIDRELVAELVGRLSAEPVALPALQFLLFALAERSGAGPLRMRDYEALGRLDGAIAARAEQLYQSLDDDERSRVRDMFELLVVVGADGEPTRRRVVRSELSTSDEIVDAWARARLLTLDVHPQHRLPTVEVAHEALVREWPRLRDWIEQDRAELIVLGRLREAAATWDELGRDPTALYRGTSLEAALDASRQRGGMTALERDFVVASTEAREAEQRVAEELIARQARTNRRLRFQVGGIALALVGALAGGLLAVDQRGAAVRERHIAVARELAAAADANLADDPERSILLSLAAIDATHRYGDAVLPEAQEALHRGVVSSRVLWSVRGAGGALAWSSDGRYFTTEGVEDSGRVDLYDAHTGAKVRSWKGDAVDLNDVSFSGDGKLLATSGDDGSVKVWSVPSGRLVAQQRSGRRTAVWGPSLNPDGSLAAASWTALGRTVVFDTRTGEVLHRFSATNPEDTTFSPDGSRLAVVSERAHVLVFDVRTGRRVYRAEEPLPGVFRIAWSPDGRWLAASSDENVAYLLDAGTGRFRFATSGQIGRVQGVAWSPDSRLLATASSDGTAVVHRMDRHGPHPVLSLAAQDLRSGVMSVAFSPDGSRLMTGDQAVTAVKVWDIREIGGAEIANYLSEGTAYKPASLTADGRAVYLAADSTHVVRMEVPERRTGSLQALPPSAGHLDQVVASPDGRHVAASTDDGQVLVWDSADGRLQRHLGESWHADWVNDLAWSRDGRLLAVGTIHEERGTVHVVDTDGRVVSRFSERPGVWMPALDFQGGRLLLTSRHGSRDNPALEQTRLWDWRTGKMVRQFDSHGAGVADDPTGALVATTRYLEGVGDVWDRRTGRHVATLDGHTGLINDISFSADGTRVATSSSDGTARVWNPRTGALLTVLRGPAAAGVRSVQFSGDGSRLLTTGDDGVVRVWTLDLDDLVRIARSRLTRGLTTAECRRYLHQVPCPAVVRGPGAAG